MSRPASLIAALAVLLLLALPLSGQQTTAPPSGGISGTVLDSDSMRPLVGATITLEADGTAALPGTDGSPFLSGGRTTLSSTAGTYRFDGLPPGRYRIRVSLVGYRPATVGVELRGAADSRLSVGLSVQPVVLEAVEVRVVPVSGSYGREVGLDDEIGGARVRAARARQQAHLSTDVLGLTHADVLESVTLAEADLFRALQRAPGVAARDDYSAALWVRGASWDQARIVFDGLPLFNPVHGFGLLSALNTDAIGGALLHPGVQAASTGGAAAAVLAVTSRSGRAGETLRGTADLSLTSGRLALDGGAFDGRGAWMLAGRRSWLDLAAAAASSISEDPQLRLPYAFTDLTGRYDHRLDGDRVLEISGLHEADRVRGTVPDVLHRTHGVWGNTAARVTYAAPLGTVRSRTTLGVSRYRARIREAEADTAAEGGFSAPGAPRSDNSVIHLSLAGELDPDVRNGRMLPWRMGYGLVREQGRYEGPPGYAHGGLRPADADSVIERAGGIAYAVLWGERRWRAGERLALETGLRAEAGPAVRNGGALRLMPRAVGRLSATDDLSFSAGLGRSYQYTQVLAGTGPVIGYGNTGNSADHIWLIADGDAPAVRADVATLGAELWVNAEWLVAANGYARHATGIALPDPAPGSLDGRPMFVSGENTARGVELSARRLAGRWTGSAAYSLGHSEMEAEGVRFPASEDRRHSVDLTSMLRLGGALRVGGAYTFATGAPYTRVYGRTGACSADGCAWELVAEERNAHRAPAYSSLDLVVDWTVRIRRWDVGAYLQLRNALGRSNAVTFSDTSLTCLRYDPATHLCAQEGFRDSFQPGLPTLPVIGFRARF